MPRLRLSLIAIVTVSLLTVITNRAFGIVVVVDSTSRLPFSQNYPENARQQVRSALEAENCRFLDGRSTMRSSTLHFAGDTASINALLQNLVDCPATVVSVSFATIDHECDWRVVHTVTTNRFNVIVNLKSNRIALEELMIPPAKGPELIRRPANTDRTTP